MLPLTFWASFYYNSTRGFLMRGVNTVSYSDRPAFHLSQARSENVLAFLLTVYHPWYLNSLVREWCTVAKSTLTHSPNVQFHACSSAFDLLIAHFLLTLLLPISLPSSSVQVMACHGEIIGCHMAGITHKNCFQALHWGQ